MSDIRRKKIVYLYTEIMPYQTIVYSEFSSLGHTVHVFYNDKGRQTPFVPEILPNVHYYPNSEYSSVELYSKVLQLEPDILVVCGWSSKKYLYVARKFKFNSNIPVVCPIDTQFTWRLKQIVGFLIAPIYIKSAFTHIWVPGVRQYYFARRMGYSPSNIVLNSLTGNVDLFSKAQVSNKLQEYPRRLLFVGRYNEVKGLRLLIDVWNSIENKMGWTIVCAGNGPLRDELEKCDGVEVLDFQSQENLVKLAETSGVFVLPSKYEPWALVLQEFAAAGLPIVCSKACGASPHFVIDNYNGYTFNTNSFSDLKRVLLEILSLPEQELYRMALNSKKLSRMVTPSISAASLLSIL